MQNLLAYLTFLTVSGGTSDTAAGGGSGLLTYTDSETGITQFVLDTEQLKLIEGTLEIRTQETTTVTITDPLTNYNYGQLLLPANITQAFTVRYPLVYTVFGLFDVTVSGIQLL